MRALPWMVVAGAAAAAPFSPLGPSRPARALEEIDDLFDSFSSDPPTNPAPMCDIGWAMRNLEYASEEFYLRGNWLIFGVNEDGNELNLFSIRDASTGMLLGWFTLYGGQESGQESHFCLNSVMSDDAWSGRCLAWSDDKDALLTEDDVVYLVFGFDDEDPAFVINPFGDARYAGYTVAEFRANTGFDFSAPYRLDFNEAAVDFVTRGPITVAAMASSDACFCDYDCEAKTGQACGLGACADAGLWWDGATVRVRMGDGAADNEGGDCRCCEAVFDVGAPECEDGSAFFYDLMEAGADNTYSYVLEDEDSSMQRCGSCSIPSMTAEDCDSIIPDTADAGWGVSNYAQDWGGCPVADDVWRISSGMYELAWFTPTVGDQGAHVCVNQELTDNRDNGLCAEVWPEDAAGKSFYGAVVAVAFSSSNEQYVASIYVDGVFTNGVRREWWAAPFEFGMDVCLQINEAHGSFEADWFHSDFCDDEECPIDRSFCEADPDLPDNCNCGDCGYPACGDCDCDAYGEHCCENGSDDGHDHGSTCASDIASWDGHMYSCDELEPGYSCSVTT